jgi:mannose-6-phosphate isomerase-like protein (cupin superfamily)
MAVNLADKLSLFSDLWSPKVVSTLNNYELKLAKLKGDFVWHKHEDTDEVFIILEGSLRIDIEEGHEHAPCVTLTKGEMYSVTKGVMHKPYAEEECSVLLIEPANVVNTGSATETNDLRAPNNEWV